MRDYEIVITTTKKPAVLHFSTEDDVYIRSVEMSAPEGLILVIPFVFGIDSLNKGEKADYSDED